MSGNETSGSGNPAAVNVTGVDAYAPAEMARRVEAAGVVKAGLPFGKLFMLAILAGAFIAFGGAFFTTVMTEPGLGYGPAKLLGGMAFSLGLILVVIGGAELFTGNALIVMAWADGKVTTAALLRNWGVAFVGNAIGAVGLAFAVYASGILDAGPVRETAVAIASAKMKLPVTDAFIRAILCNVLVCLAVWLTFAAHTVTGKAVAILFPITAFVALGFEHSIANLYLIPVGMLAGAEGGVSGLIGNLVPVTLGNIVGGAGGVAGVYWFIYARKGA